MADIITANGLTLVEEGTLAWHSKVNTNFTLIDPIFQRVAVLERFHGAELGTMWLVPESSTWTQFLAIYNGAAAGDTIILPNKTLNQTSGWQILKSINVVGHPGGLSNLKLANSVTQYGSGIQVMIGYNRGQTGQPIEVSPIRVKFSRFGMEHIRLASPQISYRVNMFTIGRAANGIEICNMSFRNASADVVTMASADELEHNPINTKGDGARNISFHDNTIDEWWESVFLLRNGSIDNVSIYNNTGVLSTASYNTAVSRPYGVVVDNESTFGVFSHVYVYNNSFDASAANYTTMGNSLGLACSMNGITPNREARFDEIYFHDNYIKRFFFGYYNAGVNTRRVDQINSTGRSYVEVSRNQFINSISFPIYIRPQGGRANHGDRMVIAKNVVVGGGGPKFLGPPAIDLQFCPNYTIHNISNSYT